MDLVNALTRVLELARIADQDELPPARSREQSLADTEACNLVEDYLVNELGDD